jgi:hypothetical protein
VYGEQRRQLLLFMTNDLILGCILGALSGAMLNPLSIADKVREPGRFGTYTANHRLNGTVDS